VDIERELDRPPKGQHQYRVTSLEADPYGWGDRHVKQAPLWMVYEAEREDVPLKEQAGEGAKKAKDLGAEITAPVRDAQGRSYATGRRKTSAARVWVKQGDGGFVVNGRPLAEYFPSLAHRRHALEPLIATQACGGFDVWLTVRGGGQGGQAGAIRHGLAKAMAVYDPFLKPVLRRFGLLTRDPRMVERKKPGQAKARKKFQWVKR
jgi:small subunit ribosomal protein S9